MSRDDVWISLTKSGSAAFNLGQYRQAKTRFRVAARDAVARQDIAQVAISLHNLALISSKQGNSRKAFRLAKKALCVLENSPAPASRLMSQILDRLADLSLNNERERDVSPQDVRRAIAYLERAHHVDCVAEGQYQTHIPHRLIRIAQLHFELKDYISACRSYKEACDTIIIGHDRKILKDRLYANQATELFARVVESKGSDRIETILQHQLIDFAPERNCSMNPVNAGSTTKSV